MGVYSDAPWAHDFRSDKPTLLVCWWCTSFAATIVAFRVCGRYIRTERLFREDWIALACVVPMFVRMACVQLVLIYGTNNAHPPMGGWSDEDIRNRMMGSKAVLASRVFYAATLWMLKLTISEFFKRLTIQIWKRSYELTLHAIRWFLLVTFIAVVISDVTECRPITHYWQVAPDPGPHCRQGFAQLLTMGVTNVITDIALVAFPIPIILRSKMTMKKKMQLVGLFSLSIIPVAITLYRVPAIILNGGVQQYRSLWASLEILAATAVANALVLGSFIRDRGVKKTKWKADSIAESMERTLSRRGTAIRHWGSDEDLVRDLGVHLEPDLRSDNDGGVRVAPMATSARAMRRPSNSDLDGNWTFGTQRSSDLSEESDSTHEPPRSPCDGPAMTPTRQISFFDVSNLLGDSEQPRKAPAPSTLNGPPLTQMATRRSISPTASRKGSHALLQDVGGLLATGPPTPGRYPRPSRTSFGGGIELQTIPQRRELESRAIDVELADVGGLLR